MASTAGAIKTWKNFAWEESFFFSGFWGFGAFSENLLNPRQRGSIKGSTMTRPQTVLVAPLLQARLHCVTTRHAFSAGLAEGWEGEEKLPPPPAALSCKPCIPHSTLHIILSFPPLTSCYPAPTPRQIAAKESC